MKQMLSELPYAHINDSSREAAAALISFEQKVSEAHKNVNSVLDDSESLIFSFLYEKPGHLVSSTHVSAPLTDCLTINTVCPAPPPYHRERILYPRRNDHAQHCSLGGCKSVEDKTRKYKRVVCAFAVLRSIPFHKPQPPTHLSSLPINGSLYT